MVEKFTYEWAENGSRREPTVQEQNIGFVSGPADPAVVNWLLHEQQSRFDDLVDQVNSYTIVDDLAIYVPSQFPTIQAAFDFLADKRIAPPAIVRIYLSAEEFVISSELTLDHPNGNRIHLIGAAITAQWPNETSIPADKATTESVLRSIFPTVVRAIGTRAMSLLNSSLGRLENILFLGDGSVNAGLRLGLRGGQFGRGAVFGQTIWFHGFGDQGIYLELGSQLTGDKIGVSHNREGCRNARSTIFVTNMRILRSIAEGLICNSNGNATVHDIIVANNGTNGINLGSASNLGAERAKFTGNGGYNAITSTSSTLVLTQPTTVKGGGAVSFYAQQNAYQQLVTPSGDQTASPANGQQGNQGAITIIA